jgi:hypothetical protein
MIFDMFHRHGAKLAAFVSTTPSVLDFETLHSLPNAVWVL